MLVYKGGDGRRSGAMTISEGEVEESRPVALEVARVYRSWKPRGRVRWYWEQHVCVQALESEEVMVLELSLPKPGGHVLSP
jgi:hypothetical protein